MILKVLPYALMAVGAAFILGVSRSMITAMLFVIVIMFITAALKRRYGK